MAFAAPMIERGPSPLASNNPFRNRAADRAISPGVAPRTTATNPFLDVSELGSAEGTTKTGATAGNAKTPSAEQTSDIFQLLSLDDTSKPAQQPPVNGAARRENVAPRPYPTRGTSSRHRRSMSEEERRRQQSKTRNPQNELDIFADPPGPNRPRNLRAPRRNSESSVRDKPKDLDLEAERRRKERKVRDGKGSHRSKKPNAKLDIIDKLDVSSIYGTGLFHHDGPFDACNPHRNRKGAKQAPIQAFPKDSVNMQLGGSGPLNAKLNYDQYNGTGQEAHVDYNEAAVADEDAEYLRRPQVERSASFNPTARIDPVHGEETYGLGTSTFLEGAPASRAAIQRRESENEAAQQAYNAGGLSRKKSLAQRIKAVRPKYSETGRMTSPEPVGATGSPLGTGRFEQQTGNPFFQDYDKDYEKKGTQIAFVEEQQKTGRARAPSSPRYGLGLERKMTSESVGAEEPKSVSTGGGFLSRVKSMKGGRSRTRERRDTGTS
ncbi:hypothetical protein HRR83_004275 [Exophiala dermatitidis]|uniref:Pal1 cell morphology protein n=2 Tax=Exophiala dermatitidis TaxID=5970 RepID=H6BQR4_EXODN|nr:uncharacterized protein HMPREF1120_02771 [Exophiala dermatitidis NIH/UT8656]KAJ4511687.1 hypothetical protein HRR73_006262 [Exophiala dermatitidis]EHY54603.1 hypothetical protein HMPREF1120_02771 [Exophiala dermatitidis NIH/UT8656]KAJ4517759.1 hypothetical protein HRR75_002977 [Exophiala dermatitidis]KAJ4521420.1 hypothetical protein HRR74_003243 [Exophiala dermatitidis]KAJ4542095.1 hypothetical protein HRR77_005979 [Exophiala dermatitidis]